MKKIVMLFFTFVAITAILTSNQTLAQTSKKSAITAGLKPGIVQYKSGNYVGAIQTIDALLEKEPENSYAKYYLALCYTRLGDKEKAETLYKEVTNVEHNNALSYYSQKALSCLSNPNGEMCNPSTATMSAEELENASDITKFIMSGKQIHPSAMDQITRERSERRLQESEYQRKLQEENKRTQNMQNYSSSNDTPTNEEIAAALNTLSKLGMNPYAQTYPLTQAMQYNQYGMMNPMMNPMLLGKNSSNSDFAKMFLYSQMAQNQNSLLNIGM